MTTRQQKRSKERSTAKAEGAQRVYITIPDELTDCMGEPWTAQAGNELLTLDFMDVLLFTVRKCPVQNAEDSERALELIHSIKDTENGYIELRRSDYDWMISQFKAHAHKIWTAPDAAHLRKLIDTGLSASPPHVVPAE